MLINPLVDVLRWTDAHNGALAAVSSVILVAITAYYARLTSQMAASAREQAKAAQDAVAVAQRQTQLQLEEQARARDRNRAVLRARVTRLQELLAPLEKIRDVGQTPVDELGHWLTEEVTALVEAAAVFSPDAIPFAEALATSLARLAAYIRYRVALSNNPDDRAIRRSDNLSQREWLVQLGNANIALQQLMRVTEPFAIAKRQDERPTSVASPPKSALSS
jgi:hypothetical protein